jgi:hypothetical protein
MMEQIIVRYVDLPTKIKGFVRVDCDGDYNVYINSRHCYCVQEQTLIHELNHIKRGDFYNNNGISEIETRGSL